MRRLIVILVIAFAGLCAALQPAFAEKRIALVIGNSTYQNVPRLVNPANDGAAIADMFRAARFDVVDVRRNLSIVEMRRALRDFSDKAKDVDIAVIYYAGHGLEVEGMNYLIPIDAMLERDRDAFDEAIPLDRVLQTIDSARLLRLVILDACRDNPFSVRMQRTLANRALGRGLAGVEPGRPNTLIAFAAKAGSTADDGTSTHSPFTTALLNHLTEPGVDVRLALGETRDEVMKATADRQEPFVYGSLGGAAVALVPAAPKPAASQAEADPQAPVRRDYELALQLGTKDAWDSFIAQYPSGFYTNLARGQLNKIAAEEARTAAAEKAKQAEAEKLRLATEKATTAAIAKAAADAKAAENARLAAEQKKQAEQQKADAAERARVAAEQAAKQKAAADASAVEEAAKADAAKGDQKSTQVATLPPAAEPPKPSAPDAKPAPQDIARALQTELRRVGCFSGNADGEWRVTSQRSLDLFNKYAATRLDAKLASLDAIDVVKSKPARICPLICDHGFRANGDKCEKIVCRDGYIVGDDSTCVKQPAKPVARRSEPKLNSESPNPAPSQPSASASTGQQIVCTFQGCRPVRKGCRIESRRLGVGQSAGPAGSNLEVCD